MILSSLAGVFEEDIYPGFPFRNRDWRAVAFERNRYDNCRMPEWFFRSVSSCFNDDGKNSLFVNGDCFVLDRHFPEIVEINFEWRAYHNFMLSPQAFSVQYKIVSKDGTCACWADSELTIFGGETENMTKVFNEHGGAESMLAKMEQEFFLQDDHRNEDMRVFLKGLLYQDKR